MPRRIPNNWELYDMVEETGRESHRYKHLRRPLQHPKRAHIDKSFVLVFSVDDSKKLVIIEDYDHHDKIYEQR